MVRKPMYAAVAALTLQIIGAARLMCPSDPNCVCSGTLAVELNCNIDGSTVIINFLPDTYINIKCENAPRLDYSKLPKCSNGMNSLKSVSFKDCPLPSSSFKDVLSNIGVSKTMALIFQNAKNLSGYFDRKHFAGLQDLTKLLLSINGVTHLPDNLFVDINKLTWLNIKSNTINLSEELFKPLERLETLEISHNHMTNISSNLFSHLSFLRKLSLWQSNVTWFSKDLFTGVDVLEELDLSSNGLNELPALIFKPLRKLRKLTLFSNKFSSLPQNLFKNNVELETVVILNNDVKLKDLPKSLFGSLPNLKQIYIQRSGLENIPYDVFANSPLITNISLAYNDIELLPESIFNDQINLLELDLSNNHLKELKPKLFSSLVRLEKLSLCQNSLEEISGSTFSPLLSLIYLNMEHNKLKTVSSYLFSNNKQRMSISLAYNNLDFVETEMESSSILLKKSSPFIHTYNLKLLNLSHNKFHYTFKDWWMNGHENLDISYNYIEDLLWDNKRYIYANIIRRPINVWLSHNSMTCDCERNEFLEFLKKSKNKVWDIDEIKCPSKEYCIIPINGMAVFLVAVSLLYFVYILLFSIFKKQIGLVVRSTMSILLGRKLEHNLIIKYTEKDYDFIVNEIIPVLKSYRHVNVFLRMIQNPDSNENFMNDFTNCVGNKRQYSTLVVFSPNYLTSTYSLVDIKKIHSEMLKAQNTIYVFVDTGPENSIYAFLKQQRDGRTTFLWDETKFWTKLYAVISNRDRTEEVGIAEEDPRKLNQYVNDKAKCSNISFSSIPELPNIYNINTLAHSQV